MKICAGCDENHDQKGIYCRDCEIEINAMKLWKEKKEKKAVSK